MPVQRRKRPNHPSENQKTWPSNGGPGANDAHYRQMFERNRAVQLLIDPRDGAILDANIAASEYYGYSIEQLKTLKITDINTLSPDMVAEEMARTTTEQRYYFNFRHTLASGEVRDVEVHSSPVELGGKQVLYSIVHDITAGRRGGKKAQRRP